MLNHILKEQSEHFAILAETWLALGATAVSIWDNQGALLKQWPDELVEPVSHPADMVAPLNTGELVLGELRIFGLNGTVARERLVADSRLIAHLIRLEDDIEDMTAELVETQDQLLAMYDLARSTRSHLDLSQTLESLVRITTRIANVQTSFIILNIADTYEMAAHPTGLFDDVVLLDLFQHLNDNEQEQVLERHTPQPSLLPVGMYNLCILPVQVGSNVIGMLGLINRPDGFNPSSMNLIRAIAGQTSSQVENVLLHRESLEQTKLQTEMDLAARAQFHLLPQSAPHVAGLEIFAKTIPAMHVGGDFYDFIYRPGRPFIFSVGDVAGKGMSAALLMAMTRTSIRSKANFIPRATPEMIISRSNDDLYSDFARMHRFATVFVGQYYPQERKLLYTNAGHSPAIYRPAGQAAQLLEANGTAMGIAPVDSYEHQTLMLSPGDILVVGTDGFSEARNPDRKMFGLERLLHLTDQLAHYPAHDIAQLWFDEINTFEAGHPQDDDQTILVIKVVSDDIY